MKQQTAVEWLLDELMTEMGYGRDMSRIDNKRILDEITKEAKEMEKEQKKLMFDCGRQYQLTGEGTFTEVYNETYGGNK